MEEEDGGGIDGGGKCVLDGATRSCSGGGGRKWWWREVFLDEASFPCSGEVGRWRLMEVAVAESVF